ncbi:MAG: hypothetical protein R3250_01165 [Melioribacteraceae bacterium]|nr:hypothetical protein [Melioribacteraceae bacterium]
MGDQINKKIDFEPVILNYENSLRGITLEKKSNKIVKVKVFPESAGSKFISKWIAHLRTILIGINSLAKLGEMQCKRRIVNNSHAYILGMILEPTVPEENMTQLAEGFNNILVDSYLGLRNEGHLSVVMREFKTDDSLPIDPEETLLDDDEENI